MVRDSMHGATFGVTMAAALVSFSAPLLAQIGSGWTEYHPAKSLQIRGCATHDETSSVETFSLTCANTSEDNRAEQRIQNDYTSGTRQFEGEVRVVSAGVNISVKQTFMPNDGAFLMIAAAADGRLYLHGGGGDVASGVIGRWVRINTIHDVEAGSHEIYADGTRKLTKTGGRRVAWHDKYGTYRSQSGRGPVVVEWRNVRYWRDGRSSGITSIRSLRPTHLMAGSSAPGRAFLYRMGSLAPIPWDRHALASDGEGIEILDLQGRRLDIALSNSKSPR